MLPAGYHGEKYKHPQQKVDRCDPTENLIFSLKDRQRKVDLNTSKNRWFPLHMTYRKFHLYVQLSHKKISYLRKNPHLRKDAAFLHFCLKES